MPGYETEAVLSAPTPAQLRAALALGYHAARKGPFGLAMIGGHLVVTMPCGATPSSPDSTNLHEMADAWRRVVVGEIEPEPRAGLAAITAEENRIRSAILDQA